METVNHLRLGVIGISEGNGHPYSWSAIFNGYNHEIMQQSPYPGIAAYLARQKFPDDCITGANVTHIWTQDIGQSKHIAQASNIPNVVTNPEDMIGHIDALLLARDDAENHDTHAKPFLRAGLPVYIDKPLAHTVNAAKALFAQQQYEGQIYTCSALRFAKEFQKSKVNFSELGDIVAIDARVPKSWKKYAIHIIEPVMQLAGITASDIADHHCFRTEEVSKLVLSTTGQLLITFTTYGHHSSDFSITLKGSKGEQKMEFADSFYAFKVALQEFVTGIRNKSIPIPKQDTLDCIHIIELGLA